jgi:hypothetical protein
MGGNMTTATWPVAGPDLAKAYAIAQRRLRHQHARETERTYRATLNFLAETASTPAQLDSSPSRFTEARAAVVYGAARALLDLGDRLLDPASDLVRQEARRIRAAVHLLLRFGDPDKPRARRPATPVGAAKGRAAGRWLGRSAPFRRGDLVAVAHTHGWSAEAIAILHLTGARPATLARGVGVRLIGSAAEPMLELRLPGTKHDPHRGKGYAWRSLRLPVDPADPVTRRLAIAAGRAGGVFTVTCSRHRLRRCLKKAARVVFGRRRGERITPYAIRHVVAARLRTTAGVETARRVLGHRTVASTLVYGGAGDHGPTPTEVQVYDASPESIPGPDAAAPDTTDEPEPDTPSP